MWLSIFLLGSQCGGLKESLDTCGGCQVLVEKEGSMPGHRPVCDTRHKQGSALVTCESFHWPLGGKKEGAEVPETVREAESTPSIAREAATCKVYLKVVGKGSDLQDIFPIILSELLKFNPYRLIPSF